MSSLTKTPAQESASADPATSVSASAGTNTSVPPQASTSTIESALSVDEYHALQYKKRVEDKAAAPETVLEGSSVFHTDGSMPTDYGSDISDVPMEEGEVPSSAADSESAAVAHDPVTGSRRPREDDPSASSSKHSRNDEEAKAPTPVTPVFSAFCPYRTRSLDAKCIRDCFQVWCDFATEPDPGVRVQRHH
ncbi:hypothetical protein PC128_g11878 [Phytophthora cactorum]|nr:hypothetical protein PC120_g10857 [Phytophthora cactorum]KAG3044938.1 hypothetical protein PC121_g21601 [Phytophthora cactorum]KAG3189201.1 hypothetical protein PC128_g11878 [Phytophthora cactorum]KAG4040400.1 hypothetical protein PC123_g24056 [Phytophthora cactorum]